MGVTTTFLFGASKIGGVPLGVVFHTEQSESNYTMAFAAVKEAVGEFGFCKQGYPSIIMTDDSLAERNSLRTIFPKTTLLLCHFHVCQAFWRWLWDSKNKIKKENRKYIMNFFRDLLYCKDEISFEELKSSLLLDSVVQQYPHLILYLNNLLSRKEEWALCYRSNLLTRGHNTNNIVESSIRIFKDIVLVRCRAFNTCALVDFVITVLESYHYRRLLNFADYRTTEHEIYYHKLLSKSKEVAVKKVDASSYHVSSKSDPDFFYTVDIRNETCDCAIGQDGRFCKHILAVCSQYNIHLNTNPRITYKDRVTFATLALGEENVNPELYRSMEYSESESEQEHEDNIEPIYTETVTPSDSSNVMIDIQNITMEITSDFSDTENTIHTDNNIQGNNSDEEVFQTTEFNTELKKLVSNIKNVSSVLEKNPSDFLLKQVKILNKNLSQVQTTEKFLSLVSEGKFYISTRSNFKSRIPVQPTAISRRIKRPGLQSGAKRIVSGALTTKERALLPKSKKRKRNLGENIALNVPNAKTH